MEPEGSLPYSQVPATCPYPELTPTVFFNQNNTLAKHGTKDIPVLYYGIWPWWILNGACISISNLPENIAWQTHKDDLRPETWGPLKSGAWGSRPTCHPQTPPATPCNISRMQCEESCIILSSCTVHRSISIYSLSLTNCGPTGIFSSIFITNH
jgi:hypothetical protein